MFVIREILFAGGAQELRDARSLTSMPKNHRYRGVISRSSPHPAQWLPPSGSQELLCRYGAEWTATELRWGLAVDELERDRLMDIAAGCGSTDVSPPPRSAEPSL